MHRASRTRSTSTRALVADIWLVERPWGSINLDPSLSKEYGWGEINLHSDSSKRPYTVLYVSLAFSNSREISETLKPTGGIGTYAGNSCVSSTCACVPPSYIWRPDTERPFENKNWVALALSSRCEEIPSRRFGKLRTSRSQIDSQPSRVFGSIP